MKTLKYFLGVLLMACIPFAANAQFMFGGGNRQNQDNPACAVPPVKSRKFRIFVV